MLGTQIGKLPVSVENGSESIGVSTLLALMVEIVACTGWHRFILLCCFSLVLLLHIACFSCRHCTSLQCKIASLPMWNVISSSELLHWVIGVICYFISLTIMHIIIKHSTSLERWVYCLMHHIFKSYFTTRIWLQQVPILTYFFRKLEDEYNNARKGTRDKYLGNRVTE